MGPQPWFGSAAGGPEAGYHIASTHSHAITSVALMLSVNSRVNAASASLARKAVATATPLGLPTLTAEFRCAGRRSVSAASRSDVVGIVGLPRFGAVVPVSPGPAAGLVVIEVAVAKIPSVIAPFVVEIIEVVGHVPRPWPDATRRCWRGSRHRQFPRVADALTARQIRRLPSPAGAPFVAAAEPAVKRSDDHAEQEEPHG